MVKTFKPTIKDLKEYIKSNKFILCPSQNKLNKNQIIMVLRSFGYEADSNYSLKVLKNYMKKLKKQTCTNVALSKKPKEYLIELANRFDQARKHLSDTRNLSKLRKIYHYKHKPLYTKITKYLGKLPKKIIQKIKEAEEEMPEETKANEIIEKAIEKSIQDPNISASEVADFFKSLEVAPQELTTEDLSKTKTLLENQPVYDDLNLGQRDIAPAFKQALESSQVMDEDYDENEEIDLYRLFEEEESDIEDEQLEKRRKKEKVEPKREGSQKEHVFKQTNIEDNPYLHLYTPEQYQELFGEPHPLFAVPSKEEEKKQISDVDKMIKEFNKEQKKKIEEEKKKQEEEEEEEEDEEEYKEYVETNEEKAEKDALNLYEKVFKSPKSCDKILDYIITKDPKNLFMVDDSKSMDENRIIIEYQYNVYSNLIKLINMRFGKDGISAKFCTQALKKLNSAKNRLGQYLGKGLYKRRYKIRGGISGLLKKAFKTTANLFRRNFCHGKSRPLLDGELHFGCHNFSGPGTRIDLKEVQDYPPYNDIDNCSRTHDLDYMNALKQGRKDLIRQADIDVINCYKKYPNENGYNASMLGINSKMKLEDVLPIVSRSVLGELSGKGRKKYGKGIINDDIKILKMYENAGKDIYNRGDLIRSLSLAQAKNYDLIKKHNKSDEKIGMRNIIGSSFAYENNRIKPTSAYRGTYNPY